MMDESSQDRFNGLKFGTGAFGDASESVISTSFFGPNGLSEDVKDEEHGNSCFHSLDELNESSWASMESVYDVAFQVRHFIDILANKPEEFRQDPSNESKLVKSLNDTFTIIDRLIQRKTECENISRDLQNQLTQALQSNKDLLSARSLYEEEAEHQEALWRREVEELRGTIRKLEKENRDLIDQKDEISHVLKSEMQKAKRLEERLQLKSVRRPIDTRKPGNFCRPLPPCYATSKFMNSSTDSNETVEQVLASCSSSDVSPPLSDNCKSFINSSSESAQGKATNSKSVLTPPNPTKKSPLIASTPHRGKFSRQDSVFNEQSELSIETAQISPVKSAAEKMSTTSVEHTLVEPLPVNRDTSVLSSFADLDFSLCSWNMTDKSDSALPIKKLKEASTMTEQSSSNECLSDVAKETGSQSTVLRLQTQTSEPSGLSYISALSKLLGFSSLIIFSMIALMTVHIASLDDESSNLLFDNFKHYFDLKMSTIT